MKKVLLFSLIVTLLAVAITVNAFADTSLGKGVYSIGQAIPSGECDLVPITSPASITIKRNEEVIATNIIPERHSFKTTLVDGDQLEVTSGEIFVYPMSEHPNAIFVSDGEYYCPEDLPSGSYKFTSIGGRFSALFLFDLTQIDEDGDPKRVGESYFDNGVVGKSYTFTINENTKMKIIYDGYLEKTSKLFD